MGVFDQLISATVPVLATVRICQNQRIDSALETSTNPDVVWKVLDQIDGTRSETDRAAIKRLKSLALGAELPTYLRQKYHKETKKNARMACLLLSLQYARDSEEAYKLGIDALDDRYKDVVGLAGCLLAISLRKEALPVLSRFAEEAKVEECKDYALRAIDAIEHQNSHYYLDVEHTGKAFLRVAYNWPP